MAKKVHISVDRISALPDDTLCHIISFLPTKYAVRTSILSTRWRYLSASTSNLDFEFYPYTSKGTPDAFMNFVDRVLFFRKRPTIDRFRLSCCNLVDPLRIDGWIHAVLNRSIQELDLSRCELDMPLPAGLFICKTLVVLRLSGMGCLKVPARVCLPSLKVLDLQYCTFKDDDFGELLSFGCPVLEDLVLAGELLGEKCKLSISNASLKRLTIGIQCSVESDYGNVEIIVNVQNLVYLKYYDGNEDNFLSCINLPSLTEAWIDFSQPNGACPDYHTSATQLMKGIQNIRLLNISSGTLLDLNLESVHLPLFYNLTCLRTSINGKQSFLGLLRLLQHSNFLETLVMEQISTGGYAGDLLVPAPLSVTRTDLPWLKAIEILRFDHDEFNMEVVKYFLENAKVLENLTIHIREEEKQELGITMKIKLLMFQLEITKELLMFPRASEKCQVRIV